MELHDRIGKVINTEAFDRALHSAHVEKIEFQSSWHKLSQGDFSRLPEAYRSAIIAGEKQLASTGEVVIA